VWVADITYVRLPETFVYLAVVMDVYTRQGVQYAATIYTRTLQELGVQISIATVGEATENGYAERFMGTIKEEEVRLHDYVNFHAAYQYMGRFLEASISTNACTRR